MIDPLDIFGPDPFRRRYGRRERDPLDIFGPDPGGFGDFDDEEEGRRHLLGLPEEPRSASLIDLPGEALARKRAEMENIREHGDIGRTEIEDPGFLGMAGATLKESVAGPMIGLAERTGRAIRGFAEEHPIAASALGVSPGSLTTPFSPIQATALVPEGLRESVRDEFEQRRLDYLATDPSTGRAITAAGTEAVANLLPYAPAATKIAGAAGAGAARLAARVAPGTFEAGSAASRLLARGVGGALEGGVVGLGNVSPDQPFAEQARQIALSVALAGGVGGLVGAHGVSKLADQNAFYPNGRLRHGPPQPEPTVKQQVLAAFEQERQQALAAPQAAAPGLPPADLVQAQQGALRAVETRWQPILARAGAAGDEALGSLADQMQDSVAPKIQTPPKAESAFQLHDGRIIRTGPFHDLDALPPGSGINDIASSGFMQEGQYVPRETLVPGVGDLHSNPNIMARMERQRGGAPISAEAGFLRLGRNRPPAPPPTPIERVMPRSEPAAPGGGPLARLQAIADRVTDQWFNREDAPVRRVRRAGLGQVADRLDMFFGRARGAGGMIDPSKKAGPVYEGTYVYDAAVNASRRTGDGLQAIVGGMDDQALFDLDSLLASERHMELLGRQEAAQLQYDWNRAQRLEELRQARQADKTSLRSMAGDVRTKQAQALQAARQEARAAGEYRAFLTSEGRLGRATPLRRHLSPAEASTDLAAGRLGAAGAPAGQTRTDALASIRSAQRVAMGIRDAATRRIPKVEKPPDTRLDIDPEGTQIARDTLAELETRYGVDIQPDGRRRIRQLGEAAERFRDWTVRAWMIPLKEAGRFTDREFTYQMNPDGTITYGGDILAKNDFYAPFQRLMEVLGDEGDAVYALSPVASGKPDPIHAISGGLTPSRPIARPTQAAVELAQKAIYWTERQRVRNALADAVDSSPELQAEIRKVPPGPGTGPKTGLPIQQRGAFAAWKDGARSDYAAPPDVLRAFEVLTPKQAGFVAQAAALAARTLRAGATITLEFPFRNLGRDVQDAAVYGPGYNPVYKALIDPFAGLLQVIGNGKFAREWRANGGALSGATAVGRPQIEAVLKDVTRGGSGVGDRVARRWRAEGWVGRIAFPALAPLEALAETLESAPKVGAFRRMRLRGTPATEAAVASRDVSSPDFGRAGTTGRAWNQYEAFFNAELQDLYRIGRAFRKAPGATTIKAMAYLTLPALANWAKNKDDPQYQDLPEWERVAFYHPIKLDNGRWVRVPRPLGLINLAFSYGPQKFIETMAGDDPNGAEELAKALFHNTPLHYVSADILPTVIQPAIEAAAGPGGWSEFRQAPIVPQGLQGQLPQERALDQTSGIARAVGGAVGVAPLKIDYLLHGYGAFWGRTLAQGTGPAARALGADPAQDTFAGRMAQGGSPELPIQAKDIPGVRGFVSTPAIGFASEPVSRFYQVSTEAAQAKKSFDDASDRGDAARVQSIIRSNPEIILADSLAKTREELNELRKLRNEILRAPGLTKEQRLEQVLMIDQMATQLAGVSMHGLADYLRGMR